MMGLLDTLDDPQTRLGLGLLAAAAPRFDNAGMGQRLMEAVGSLDEWKQNQLKKQYMDMQMKNLQSEVDTRAAALEKQRQMQDTLSGMFGGRMSATGALSAGAAAGDVGPTVTNAARMSGAPMGASTGAPGSSRLASMSPDQLALLKANGLDLTDVYKLARPNINFINGVAVDMNSVKPGFSVPQMSQDGKASQLTQNPDGTWAVSAPKGAVDTFAGYTAAQEAAKAPYQVMDIPTSGGGSVKMTLADYLKRGPQSTQSAIPSVGTKQPSAQDMAIIEADAKANGIKNPYANFSSQAANVGEIGRTPTAFEKGQQERVSQAGLKLNDAWMDNSLKPVVAAGNAAQSVIDSANVGRKALQAIGGGGWGTETKATAANILSGLGVAPEKASMYASNAQIFQKTAMDRLWSTLNDAKGPQTEGDANRASKTFSQLSNTPRANEFILDLTQAKAERDKAKAVFYNNALPIAQKDGDLTEIDRQWAKRMPSIFDMPTMKKWNQQ